jgi:hypothetical protein
VVPTLASCELVVPLVSLLRSLLGMFILRNLYHDLH